MKFIVQEIQKDSNGNVALLPAIVRDDRDQAESAYYSILSFAAVSSLPVHAACIYNEEGVPVMNKAYYHIPEPEPEPNVSE